MFFCDRDAKIFAKKIRFKELMSKKIRRSILILRVFSPLLLSTFPIISTSPIYPRIRTSGESKQPRSRNQHNRSRNLSTSPTSGKSKQPKMRHLQSVFVILSTSPTSGKSKQPRPSKPFSTNAFGFTFAKGRKCSNTSCLRIKQS